MTYPTNNKEVKKAVIRLLEIANSNTGSSAAVAYVLLSAYDSFHYAIRRQLGWPVVLPQIKIKPQWSSTPHRHKPDMAD